MGLFSRGLIIGRIFRLRFGGGGGGLIFGIGLGGLIYLFIYLLSSFFSGGGLLSEFYGIIP